MAVEENKKTHRRIHEEIWMNHNLDNLEDLVCEDLKFGETMVSGYENIREGFKRHFESPESNPAVAVEHHLILGEDDYLMIWQTNTRKDGSKIEGVTVAKYRDGKLAENRWFNVAQQQTG